MFVAAIKITSGHVGLPAAVCIFVLIQRLIGTIMVSISVVFFSEVGSG